MATCAPYAPLKKRRHSAMKSPPSSEHGIAHPVKTWPSSLVSRFPHFLKTRFTRFPHFSGYRAALFRPRDCIKRRFRRFYRLTVKRRAATRPACGMEVRLVPRRPSAASRQCPHLGDAGLWQALNSRFLKICSYVAGVWRRIGRADHCDHGWGRQARHRPASPR